MIIEPNKKNNMNNISNEDDISDEDNIINEIIEDDNIINEFIEDDKDYNENVVLPGVKQFQDSTNEKISELEEEIASLKAKIKAYES